MTPLDSAEILRDRWHKAQQQTLGEEILAFADLAAHPEARRKSYQRATKKSRTPISTMLKTNHTSHIRLFAEPR